MWFMSYTNDPIVMFFSHGKVIHQIIFNSTNEWEKKWIRLWNSYSTPRVRVLNCELLRANHLTNHLHAASFFFFYSSPPFKFLMGQGCSSSFSSSFFEDFQYQNFLDPETPLPFAFPHCLGGFLHCQNITFWNIERFCCSYSWEFNEALSWAIP